MILILTEETDKTSQNVIDWLVHYEVPYLRINSEDIINLIKLRISNTEFSFSFEIRGVKFDFKDIKVIWCRRGTPFINSNVHTDSLETFFPKLKEQIILHLKEEKNEILGLINHYIASKFSINSFEKYHINKLICLYEASKIGLKIPNSQIVTSVSNLAPLKNGEVFVTKSIRNNPVFIDGANSLQYFNLTTRLKDLKENAFFFPSLIQAEVSKWIEIRTFFIFSEFYSMAIFSQNDEKTSIDYRDYNDEIPNRNCPFKLPNTIEKKLRELMKKIGLNSGSVDLILDKNGDYVFLEVNPIGQFGALSYICNYNLEEKIAKRLKDEYEKK